MNINPKPGHNRKESQMNAIFRTTLAAVLVALGLPMIAWAAEPPKSEAPAPTIAPVPPLFGFKPGLETMAHPDLLPILPPPGLQTRQLSFYNHCGINADRHYVPLYTDENDESVLFDEYGPGCMYRWHVNLWQTQSPEELAKVILKFYFDDEKPPRLTIPLDAFFQGKEFPFKPFGCRAHFYGVQYFPFAFSKRLKITWNGPKMAPGFSDGNSYILYPPDTKIESWTPGEDGEAVRQQWLQTGKDPKNQAGNLNDNASVVVKAGESAILLNLQGAGAITSLKMKLEPYTADTFFDTWVRMTWDDQKTPAVEMPLGMFFGSGDFGLELRGQSARRLKEYSGCVVRNLFYGWDGKEHTMYCYWPMPYWSAARIEVINKSNTDIAALQLSATHHTTVYPKGFTGYFGARRMFCNGDTTDPAFKQKGWITLYEESGHGKIVGRTYYSKNTSMEHDEMTYIDGKRWPDMHGNGTEDDYNQGWTGIAIQQPYWGGIKNGFENAWRLYVNDYYGFFDKIQITTEGIPGNKVMQVVYYYKSRNPETIQLTDEIDVGKKESESLHGYQVTGETWSGVTDDYYDGSMYNIQANPLSDDGRAFNGSSEFTVKIDPDNCGVRLRRRTSIQKHNYRQTAWVYVDGVRVNQRPWHTLTSRHCENCEGKKGMQPQAWVDSDFELPASLTKGKKQLKIRIEFVSSTRKEWNEYYYWVYSYPAAMVALR